MEMVKHSEQQETRTACSAPSTSPPSHSRLGSNLARHEVIAYGAHGTHPRTGAVNPVVASPFLGNITDCSRYRVMENSSYPLAENPGWMASIGS